MDNIKKLMSQADPVTQKNIGEPGPLNLDEPIEVFAQQPLIHQPVKRRQGWRIVAAGGVVAMLSAGIILWSPWKLPAPPMPAGPTIPVPGPTPTSGIDESVLPKIDYGLPNFLVPAHQDVYFQDSQACNALGLENMKLLKTNGTETKLANNVNAYPIVGCVDGFAAIQSSDLAFADGYNPEGSTGIFIAQWQDGQWVIDEKKNPGISRGDDFPIMDWPTLRGMGYPKNPASAIAQEAHLTDMGVSEQIREKLLGPNVPVWMGKKPETSFIDYGNDQLEVTYPDRWQMKEHLFDEGSDTPIPETKESLAKLARYELRLFDERGKQVFYLISANKGSIFEPNDCSNPESSYIMEGQSPSGLINDAGPLQLALMTFIEPDGRENSRVGLFPANLPATGRSCDVRLGVDIGERTFYVTEWIAAMGFTGQAERDAYLESSEYANIKKVAASMILTPPKG